MVLVMIKVVNIIDKTKAKQASLPLALATKFEDNSN